MAGVEISDIKDFQDIVRLLEAHPEWRADLRRLILTDEILNLPAQVSRLVEQVTALTTAQQQTDELLAQLIAAQQRTEARLETLTAKVEQLAEAQARTDALLETLTGRIDGLTTQMAALTAQMVELTRTVQKNTDDIGKFKGWGMEIRFRTHCGAFFGPLVRRPRLLSEDELSELVEEAVDQGKLSDADAVEILRTDMVVRGTRKVDKAPLHLVVEVSWTVDTYDVERAAYRAALLAKTGVTTQPVVAGATVRPPAADLAFGLQVWQVTDKEALRPEG